MFKTVVIAALGFVAVSAQFLDERFLQGNTTNSTTAAPAPASIPAISYAAACSADNCNAAGYCCAAYTRAGAAGTAPTNICVPTDFIGQNLTIGGQVHFF